MAVSITHGRRSTYDARGCRCASCRAAASTYRKALRARRRRPPIIEPVHGRVSTYNRRRCRCQPCRLAKNAYACIVYARAAARRSRPPRFPLGPLEYSAGITGNRRLAEALGESAARVSAYRQHGLVDALADAWAIALGLHPGEVWPEW